MPSMSLMNPKSVPPVEGGGVAAAPAACAAEAAASAAVDAAAALLAEARRRAQPFIIGVAGGTASGKTTVCDYIMSRLHDSVAALISQDSYYRPLTPSERDNVSEYNFDAPGAFDSAMLLDAVLALKAGRTVEVPAYDFVTHSRRPNEVRKVEPADVVIVEGILVLHDEALREHLNMKIYVDTDDDVRLARRIQRDVQQRGRDVAGVIEQYTRFVKPSFDQYVAPSRRHADVIIPWQRGDNLVAIDLIAEHIRGKVTQHALRRLFPNLELLPSNYQIRGMHTILRDRTTPKNDFVFYADRLNRLVVEHALGHLPFAEARVTTPTGAAYAGVAFDRKLCGVSVIRSGESMEAALRSCCSGVKIGKILVVRHHGRGCRGAANGSVAANGGGGGGAANGGARPASPPTAPQEVIYEKLPPDVAQRYVLLMDPILSTGSSAAAAVEVLLSKGVAEDRILFLCLIAAPEGVIHLCGRYPRLKVVASEIDRGVDGGFAVVPGCGDFGDRYFSE